MAAAWQRLSPRERRLVGAAALLAVLFLGWLLLWRPLSASREALRAQVAWNEGELAWMRQAAPLAAASAATASQRPEDGRSLLARVDAAAREVGLGESLLRVEPVSANEVRVAFAGADFDLLAGWLERFSAAHGVTVTELSVQRAEGVGRVDARLALRAGGGR